jgi:hypothetical protein
MKKIAIILLNLTILSAAFGQNINNLDEKNGFKDFTLGDNFSKWKDELTSEKKYDDGTKTCLYTGECCQKVFNYSVDKIILRFDSEKLVGIYITTEKFQKEYSVSGKYTTWRADDFQRINFSFSNLFGKVTLIENNDKGGEITYIWKGKKTMLLSTYEYLGIQNGDRQQIVIVDMSFLEKELQSGF